MLDKQIQKIEKWLHPGSRILLTSHHNPDGDAIGSIIALYHFLKKLGYEVNCLVPNDFPDFLKWMQGAGKIRPFREKKDADLFAKADIIYCLDYNSPSRAGKMEKLLRSSEAKKVLIDHHPDPDPGFFDAAISTVKISSTAELVYRYIVDWKGESFLSRSIAAGIYVGIMTDTGSFSFSCNYPSTFEACAELLKTGIDAEEIHRLVYDNYSEARLRLLGFCLYDRLTIIPEYSLAYIALTKGELERYQFKPGDTEGIVNYPLSIKGIKVSVMLLEREEKVRLSFRSKGTFPVNAVAREHFEGGGHRNAAGGDSHITLDETILKLIEILPQYKELIDAS